MQTRCHVSGIDRIRGATHAKQPVHAVGAKQRTPCLRGRRQVGGRLQPVSCSSNDSSKRDDDLGQGRPENGDPDARLHQDQEMYAAAASEAAIRLKVTAKAALYGLSIESVDSVSIDDWSPSPRVPQTAISSQSDDAGSQGWYKFHLFDVFSSVSIDVQSASHFFSQLTLQDSPLSMDEMLHVVRVADITGFALPPMVAAQLQQMVQGSSPNAAAVSPGAAAADPLVAAFGHDLPVLLDVLYGMEVTPSAGWVDSVLQAWVARACSSGTAPPLTVTGVRSVMALLEAMFVPNADAGFEPLPPAVALAAAADPYTGHVRGWLDLLVSALLDGGALVQAHAREELYSMLPNLATAPSASVVERLYREAPPPHSPSAGGSGGGSGAAAAPEYVAGVLWLIAASGAKLPPPVAQGELRALEQALYYLATAPPPSPSKSSGPDSPPTSPTASRSVDSADGPLSSTDAATAAAAAALKAAFALPSSPGSRSGEAAAPLSPHPTSSPPSYPPTPSPPFRLPSSLKPRPAGPRGSLGRLSPHGAYLCFWAIHHYRHSLNASMALFLGQFLLSTLLPAARGLAPRQRCRVLRSLLLCFDSGNTQAELLSRNDWSPLFVGWENLRAEELMPLLQDVATVARQRRRLRRRSDGGLMASASVSASSRLPLLSLAAHVVQLPGWRQRLAGQGLAALTGSVTSLLEVLTPEEEEGEGVEEREGGRAAVVLPDGAQQELLTSWLTSVLPAIQEGVKDLTGSDWGSARRLPAPAHGDHHQHHQHQHLPHMQPHFAVGTGSPSAPSSSSYMYDVHDSYDIGSAVGATQRASAAAGARSPGFVAAAAAGAATEGTAPRDRHSLHPAQLAAAAAPQAPPLSAGDLVSALSALRDAAAALDARSHPSLHRTLMWALQRLGARAGRSVVEPAAFGLVPDMLVKVDSLGWVEMPLEWVDAVVTHPDPRATWFRSLAWPEALRAVLVSGQLVERARAEMLRRHGLPMAEPAPGNSNGQAAAAAVGSSGGDDVPVSKAGALLAAATRLRNHMVGLLAARARSSRPSELRQVAVIWQTYGLPYDKEALGAVLNAVAAVLTAPPSAAASWASADGGEEEGGDGEVAGGYGDGLAMQRPLWDAVGRLEAVCSAHGAPTEEVNMLFSGFW